MTLAPRHFEALFRRAPGPVVVYDARFTIVAANEAYFRAKGTTAAIIGRNVFEVFPDNPGDPGSAGTARSRASLERVLETGEPDRTPVTRHDVPRAEAEGGGFEVRYRSSSSYAVPGEDGRTEYIVQETEDVTEAVNLRDRDVDRRAEELAEARGIYEAIYDQGLFAGRLDLEGRVSDANRSCLEQCGFAREDVIGKPFWECGWWNRSPAVQAWVRAAFEKASRGEPFRGESAFYWADGTERVAEFACMPVRDDSGRVRFVLATGMDITERVRDERGRRATAILESITDAFFALDRQWRFTYLNPQAEPQLMRTRGELVGKVLWDEFPAARGTRFDREYRRTMTERVPVTFEEFYPAPLDAWYEVNAYPTDEGLAVYFRNVTERRASEERLRASEGRFRALATATSDVLFRMSPDWSEMQPLDGRAFVASNEAPIRDWMSKNIPPSEHARIREAIDEAVRTRGTFELEHRVRRADGSVGWTFSRAVPILGEGGEIVEWFGTASDVTRRKEAESEKERVERESERQRRIYEAALSNTPDLVYVFDLAHRFTYANEALLRVWGRARGDAIGKNCLELGYEPWHAEMHDREIDRVVATKQPFRGEVPFTGTGGRRVYDYIFVPVIGADGSVVAVAGTTRDVTDRQAAEAALRESEGRFRQIADNLPGGAIYQAAAGGRFGEVRFPYVSRGMERLFGFTPEEIEGDPRLLFGLVHDEDLPRVFAANERAMGSQCPFDEQFRSRARDGSVKWVHARSAPRETPAGLVWDGVVMDITAEKQAEARQTLLAEAGRILGSSLDYERTLSDVCRLVVPGFADWSTLDLVSETGGVERVELVHSDPEKVALAREFRRRYPPDPRDEHGLMKVIRSGEPEMFAEIDDEVLRRGAKDEEHYRLLKEMGLRSVIIVPLAARGRTLGAMSLVTAESGRRYTEDDVRIASEIASRTALAVDNARLLREAEDAARRREEALSLHKAVDEQLTLLVEASGGLSASLEPASVLDAVVSLSRRLVAADAYAIWRHDEASGRWGIVTSSGLSEQYRHDSIEWLESTPWLPDGPFVAEDVLGPALLEGRRERHEREGVRSLLVVPLRVRGKADGTLTFYYRTPHRFSEVEVRVATAIGNLASSAIATSELYEALKDNDRKKDEFLAMLAHELRNPLSAIGNAVQLARRSRAEGHQEWSREVIDKHVASLSRMIDDLLDVSRITRGKIELRREPLDILPVVAHAVETVRPLVRERKHALTVTPSSSSPMWVDADAHRLEQVLVNLLNNAAKYTDSGGRITLSVNAEGDSIAVTVADNGTGIPPERIPEMFELFAQGDRSVARSEGGLGIGLTLVKSLVEMHGGSVAAKSAGAGKGSEFTVRLPAVAAPAPERAHATPPPPPPVATPSRTRARVLVVDDNRDSAVGLARLLKVLGNDVEVAADGPSALESARRLRPDFVLLDIGLPGMDGYEVAERLRAEGFVESVIIAVSGYGEEAARKRSREAGFDHHLVKPVNYDELVALIRRG